MKKFLGALDLNPEQPNAVPTVDRRIIAETVGTVASGATGLLFIGVEALDSMSRAEQIPGRLSMGAAAVSLAAAFAGWKMVGRSINRLNSDE